MTTVAYRWTEPKDVDMDRVATLLGPSIAANQFTNDGPGTRALAAFLHTRMRLPEDRTVLTAASGTAALHALVAGYNIVHGRALTWATQAMTFPSAVLGPLRGSVVVDNDPVHHGPSLEALEAVRHTVDGVVVTNMFGFLCNVQVYEAWCRAHGKLLLFDNAATPMSFIEGTNSCAAGDGAFISLHETKPWGRGEGGAVVCPTGAVAAAVHRAMNFGFHYGQQVRVSHAESSNWRMSDIAAAFIQSHIETLEASDTYSRVAAILAAVDEYLHTAPDTRLQWGVTPTATVFPACLFLRVRTEWPPVDVDTVSAFAAAIGIEAKQYYVPLTPPAAAPVAWAWYSRVVCLPLHWKTGTGPEAVANVRALDTFLAGRWP
jgi:dTDP-4-amino-4,6-dideoxygalactose transaminase